ncbi:MAG: class I SAM-dependent methyltransferase [Thiohalocapsa sp.]
MFNIEFLHVIRHHEIAMISRYLRPGARVLELGGGTGYQAKLLSERGFDVTSIDLPTTNYREHQVYPVIPYDGRHFPFADRSFDVVFSSNLLEHVEDLAALHRETARVLKPDGYAVHVMPTSAWRLWTMMTHYTEMVQRIAAEMAPHLLPLGRRSLRSALRSATAQPAGGSSIRSAIRNAVGIARYCAIAPRHGEKGNALTELFWFSNARWRRHFAAHRLLTEQEKAMGLFYTGHMLLGRHLSLRAREGVARLAGSACRLWVVKFPRE